MIPGMPRDPRALLPLKPLVFQLLVALLDGDRHGWSLLRAAEGAGGGGRLMPGQLYRQLESMLAEALVTEHAAPHRSVPPPAGPSTGGARPTRFFRLTPFGRAVARAEAHRLAELVSDARVRPLLSRTRS
jgi:DNA-binding PadR family transcriptional regulator